MDAHDLEMWVRGYLARLLGTSDQSVCLETTFAQLGLDSVDAVIMAGELEDALDREIDPASFLQYDTFREMVEALASHLREDS